MVIIPSTTRRGDSILNRCFSSTYAMLLSYVLVRLVIVTLTCTQDVHLNFHLIHLILHLPSTLHLPPHYTPRCTEYSILHQILGWFACLWYSQNLSHKSQPESRLEWSVRSVQIEVWLLLLLLLLC